MLTFIQNLPYSHFGEAIDSSTISFDMNPNWESLFTKIPMEVVL